MAKATVQPEQPAVRLKATPARQGFLHRDILAVLLVSTGLAMVVLLVTLALNSTSLSNQGAQTRVPPASSAVSGPVATPGPLPSVD